MRDIFAIDDAPVIDLLAAPLLFQAYTVVLAHKLDGMYAGREFDPRFTPADMAATAKAFHAYVLGVDYPYYVDFAFEEMVGSIATGFVYRKRKDA